MAPAGRRHPQAERRTSEYLTHPVFHEHHSETEMLRYLRRLADSDVALDRAMIPLGSCTMKLNATTEMEPVTWPEFADIHPFAPLDQAEGYLELIARPRAHAGRDHRLRRGVAPAQRRVAGRAGRAARHPRLPPQPGRRASGTCASSPPRRTAPTPPRPSWPACGSWSWRATTQGNVDVDDFRAKADAHADDLAALMVTYPSTHGVFEARITEICDIVHSHGGQVYVDGANLNALVGVARPGWFGGDVSHLNLHKTFCIPHGGGGPGVGPVAARAHLAPFLPNHPPPARRAPTPGPGPVSAAPWGSAAHPADQLDLHQADGPRRAAPGDGGRHPERQLRRRPARRPLPGPLHRRARPGGARVHHRHPRPSPRTPA